MLKDSIKLKENSYCAIDLDNTIINYNAAFEMIAPRFGLPRGSTRHAIRKSFKSEDGTDHLWQEFQSLLYTEGLNYAAPSPGLMEFLEFLKRSKVRVSIISHKTSKTQERFGALNLREPALKWLESHGILGKYLPNSSVFFSDTQDQKIDLILRENPNLFIDDLREVLEKLAANKFQNVWLYSSEESGARCGDFYKLRSMLGQRHE